MPNDFEQKQKELYKTLKPVYCPALKEMVYFTNRGFQHLLFKNQRPRLKSDASLRLSLLPHVQDVISRSSVALNRIHSTNPLVETWSVRNEILMKDGSKHIVRVVLIRRKPHGKVSFLSIMTEDK